MSENLSPQELQDRYWSLRSEYQEYKTRNQALKEAKKRFYSLSNHTKDGIYTFNLSIQKYVYTNPAFIKMFGQPCKDIVTTDSAMGKILPADKEKLRYKIEASLDNKEGDESEYRCIGPVGSIRWMHDRWVVIRDDHRRPTAIEGIVRDITEMKDIISIKDYLESMFESCMDAIIVTNEKGIITLVNKGAEALFNTQRKNLVGNFIGEVIRNELNDHKDIYQLIMANAPTSNYELEAQLLNGVVIPLLISFSYLEDEHDKPIGTIIYMRDISVKKHAEKRIRALSQQLIRAQEVERSSIARDLHDHLAQNLYYLNIRLKTFLNQLPLPQTECETQSTELMDALQNIITDVRKMVFNIHPTSIDKLGLTNTLNNLCQNVSQLYGLEINFKTAGMDHLKTNFDLNSAIFRVVQEGLNNIVKHAEAQKVEIRLVYSHPEIILRIEDDGKGFDVEQHLDTAAMKGCMGIWSMRERVALLSGQMTIDSKRRIGTRIVIEIPFYQEKQTGKSFV
ncbi:MAG: PAS domain S-box protein [Desulfobacterales bacterium]